MKLLNRIRTFPTPYLLCFAVIIATRLATFLAFPSPASSPDTNTYFRSSWLNFDLVSFSGHAGRGWLVPFIYALLPNQISVTAFQLTLSTIAWIFLIVGINKNLNSFKSRSLSTFMLSILSITPQLIQHDAALLSTSITNSLLLISLGILFRFKAGFTSRFMYVVLAVLLGLLFVQKTTFILLALPIASLGIFLVFKTRIKNRTPLTLLMVSMFIYGSVVGVNVNNNWQVSYSGQTMLWHLGGQSPIAESFGTFLRQDGAPSCIYQNAPYDDLDLEIGRVLNDCPSAHDYLKKDFQKDFAQFLLSHPMAAIKLASLGFGAASTSAASNYGNAVTLLPINLDKVFFGQTNPNLADSKVSDQVSGMKSIRSQNIWLYSPMFLWWFLSIVLLLQLRLSHHSVSFEAILVGSSLLSMTSMFVLLPSEWVRQSIPNVISIFIVSIFIVSKSYDLKNYSNPPL